MHPQQHSFRKRLELWLRKSVSASSNKLARYRKKPAQSHKLTKSRFSPSLPPEIWALVIRHACLLYHDPLDASHQLSFLEPSTASQLHSYRISMTLKTSISLVSKHWNALARMFLYEFVWISRAAQAKALARTLLMEFIAQQSSSGAYLRRLHIETPALERCSPEDLRTILDFAPSLCIYSDHHSVQRSLYSENLDPRCSPEEILKLVAHPKMRRLSWTSYGDVPFQQRMTPLLKNLAIHLEYLELSSCSPNFRTLFAQSLGHSSLADTRMNVHLPSLRALKVSLDNNTFDVLASWDMPLLTNLSVLSSDFSYTGPGFASFFRSHGAKLRQLELGHSSSLIEEYYLTVPQHTHQPTPIPLADWCPNLREFVCSADAEWHWRSPDWIAPHILLPAHPRIEFIGIRDIDRRLNETSDYTPPTLDGLSPYFTLYQQMCSLLQAGAFPSLRFIRDLSVESHKMRNVMVADRVLQFWLKVVERCQERGIWCEDYLGVNLTARSLIRASLSESSMVHSSG
ncbi:hypothetical protein NLI96_g10929 [Meripilus lineatus]|uniref:Uncharacterized protein n=1 Tax=Meripilus lineatus TaxID=2056292 RepID=A0AAD5USQ0_9APHY|nr:hypothetical protein NLI96_g10929 [Physisporinus lineatus]